MKIIDQKYVEKNKKEIVKAILDGKIFIYPTDTIYGIGCDARNDESVQKIRSIKKRDEKPMSVIAPNFKWIEDNCVTDFKAAEDALAKLPGPYTIFFDLNNQNCVSRFVNPIENCLYVRIPKNWFSEIIKDAGVPFITTSVNLSGEPHMTGLDDLNEKIKMGVDFIVYEGKKAGTRSEKIDLRKNQ